MSDYFDAFRINAQPVTDEKCTVISGKVRISVLTDRLFRVERSENGAFCDEPTQSVWYRDFDTPEFKLDTNGNSITVRTEAAELCVNAATGSVSYIKLSDLGRITDFKAGNLKGTTRTLDRSFGAVPLGDGIMSKNGVAVLDDSSSLIISDDGTIATRDVKEGDKYYFAYGRDYRAALRDFFKLTGFPVLVPRFALGNWWSRYKAYTQQEYVNLMQRFIDSEIPITVATVDMDWHWVDVKSKFGKNAYSFKDNDSIKKNFYDAISKGGWTGYSWNTDLFPDYREFLNWLHGNNFKVTLNLHPASGVRWFEDQYAQFAEFMGDNPDKKKAYPFDITDKKYVEGYFRFLHKPYEKEGVDFWWIDWQQGNKTSVKGLDPLWALNHYHSMDIALDGSRRPLILSRFAGAGSHRYPLGFSGDTAQNWRVLDFQPYFTANAANIGYTWWSHDIGGHHYGKKDDELYLRWVQFGVFSPIMRLHSTSNEFLGKEPWKYSEPVERLAVKSLKLRHRLIPYIYSMNYLTHTQGRALVEPMYYGNPDSEEAYNCKNEYRFGTELIVCPITEPVSDKTNMASVKAWLPEGRYTDIFTGRIYRGGKIRMFRDISSIPVLAKEGAIIPLDVNERTNYCGNPKDMELMIYRGNNSFTLYEDDGESMNYQNGERAETLFKVSENTEGVSFSIESARGDKSVLPDSRSYLLRFMDIVSADSIKVLINGGESVESVFSDSDGKSLSVRIGEIKPEDNITVALRGVTVLKNQDKREALIETVSKYQTRNNPKAKIYTDYVNGKAEMPRVASDFRGPLEEIENLYYF